MSAPFIRAILLEQSVLSDYTDELPAVRALERIGELNMDNPVTFFVGENGSGKSTLLEAIAVACGFNAEGGTKNFNFASCESHSALHNRLKVKRGTVRERDGFFLRAESFYNVATEIDRLDKIDVPLLPCYGGTSLHSRSHGESFMALLLHRFGKNGLFILDEPEAALSATRQLSMLMRIRELTEQNCQFIIATHSPILSAYPNACIYELNKDGIERISYEQSENYIVTKDFLSDPARALSYLFGES